MPRSARAPWAGVGAIVLCTSAAVALRPHERIRRPAMVVRATPTDPRDPHNPVWRQYWAPPTNPVRDRGRRTWIMDRWVDPRPGMRIADIGAGGGYFTLRFAPRVLPGGQVTATDIDPTLARSLSWEAQRQGLSHVRVLLTESDELGLDAASTDVALASDVPIFCANDPDQPAAMAAQLQRAVRPGGRFIWIAERPNPARQGECVMPDELQLREILASGFEHVETRGLSLTDWRGFASLFRRRGANTEGATAARTP